MQVAAPGKNIPLFCHHKQTLNQKSL
jgi:hypothetical protein